MPKEISDGTVIWRYFSFRKFLKLLRDKSLYFCRADILKNEDPYEATLDPCAYASLDLIQNLLKLIGFPPEITEINIWDAAVIKNFYINCWHINDHESYLMWKVYAHKGVAIKTTVGKLKECLKDDLKIKIKEVTYEELNNIEKVDFNELENIKKQSDKKIDLIEGIFGRKIKQFREENELRLIYHSENDKKNGVKVDIDLEKLINEVYINPTLKKCYVELVQMALKRSNLNKDVMPSVITNNKISSIKFSELKTKEQVQLGKYIFDNSSFGAK